MVTKANHIGWPEWDRITLSKFQYDVITDPARLLLVNAGRFSGKDFCTTFRVLMQALMLYAQRIADPEWYRPGPRVVVMIIAPVSHVFDELWARIKESLPALYGFAPNGKPHMKVWEKETRIELFGGDLVIRANSAFNPDNLRGQGADIMYITEAAYLDESDWDQSLSAVVLRAGFAGLVTLNSTPRNNWWDTAVAKALRKEGYWGEWSVHQASSFSNPKLAPHDYKNILSIRDKNVYTYRREYLAELFIDIPDDLLLSDGVELAYDPDLIDRALLATPCGHTGPYYVGFDLATTGPDNFAIAVVCKATGLVVHVETHKIVKGRERIMELMGQTYERWKPIRMLYDGNGPIGKSIAGRPSRWKCEPLTIYPNQKHEWAMRMEAHLVHGSIKIPHPELWGFTDDKVRRDYQLLLRELRAYRKLTIRSDSVVNHKLEKKTQTTYHKPPGGSDDVLEAVIYALHGFDPPRGSTRISEAEQSAIDRLF